MDGFRELMEQSDYQDVYNHPSWKTETAKYEQELAKRLYDQQSVRAAGQKALSQISKLLIRYNRLKEADKKKKDFIGYEQFKENNYHQKMLEKLKAKEGEVGLITDEEVRNKRSAELEAEKAKEETRHGQKLDSINAAGEKMVQDDLVNNIENDRFGGILSSLMLGGRTAGARNYTLTTGDVTDLSTGKDYIEEISGEEGTLIDQMSLIDTAVNTAGIQLVDPSRKGIEGESVEGATYSLNDVLRNVTEDDQKRMNIGGIGNDLVSLNFEKIGEAQKNENGMDSLIGETRQKSTLQEAFNNRNVKSGVMMPEQEFVGSKNKLEREKEYSAVKGSSVMNRLTRSNSLGSLFTIFDRREHNGYRDEEGKYHRYKSHDERREKMKEEFQRDYSRYITGLMAKKAKKKKLNPSDSSENTLAKLKKIGADADSEVSKNGFLSINAADEWLEGKEKQQQPGAEQPDVKDVELNVAKNIGDKSARNMMAAYAMIESDKKQQFLFRLALIAYMVPTGKKSLYDILKESQEAGVTGEENLSEAVEMYRNIYPLNEAEYNALRQDLKNPVETVLEKIQAEGGNDPTKVKFRYTGDEKRERIAKAKALAEKTGALKKKAEAKPKKRDPLYMIDDTKPIKDPNTGKRLVSKKEMHLRQEKKDLDELGTQLVPLITDEDYEQVMNALKQPENQIPDPEPKQEPPVNQNEPPVNQNEPPVNKQEPPVNQGKPPVKQEEENIDNGPVVKLQNDLKDQMLHKEEVKKEGENLQNEVLQIEKELNEKPGKKENKQEEKQEQQDQNNMQALQQSNALVGQQDFVPPRRFKPGFGTWLKNRIFSGVKAILGIAAAPITLAVTGIAKLVSKFKKPVEVPVNAAATRKMEHARTAVPGQKKAYLADLEAPKDQNGEEMVMDQADQVPLVWEQLSAAEANPDKKPEMSLMVEQATKGSTVAASGTTGMGHAMVGLRYNRFNRMTNRLENYLLRFGFYPKGGFIGGAGELQMGAGAMMPGMLRDDSRHGYHISRTYEITPKQVNDVLKAAQKYPEEGGYGYYKRNCTTFMVDMAKTAGLGVADEFHEEEMNFNFIHDVMIGIADVTTVASYQGAKNNIIRKMDRTDISYQNFGEKMATMEDLKRYQDTSKFFGNFGTKTGYSPGMEGQRLTASEQGGTIGAHEDSDKYNEATTLEEMREMINEQMNRVCEDQVLPNLPKKEDEVEQKLMESDVKALFDDPVYNLRNITDNSSAQDLKDIYLETSMNRDKVWEIYTTALESIPALQSPILELMGVMEMVLTEIDTRYQDAVRKEYKGDLKLGYTQYEEADQSLSITVKEGAENKTYQIRQVSPSLYEAYLQMFGSPEAALKEMALYEMQKQKEKELVEAGEESQITKYNTREDRIRQTALNFVKAHNYRLNKETYNEDDMEYAFKTLPELEKKGEDSEMGGTMFRNDLMPSSLLQAVVFKPIFEGILDDPLPEEGNENELGRVLSTRLTSILERSDRKEKMKRFLSYFIKNLESSGDEQVICNHFIDLFSKSYIRQVVEMADPNYNAGIMGDQMKKGGDFKDIMLTLIREVLS